ncbi:MAG: C39 family peptidase [Candidatus Buchananbacteria bacterium]|nr:C39 family peptidase [Candidatus Buchananbacteria bacterium]
MSLLIAPFIGIFLAAANISPNTLISLSNNALAQTINITETDVPEVPFYSQFSDISSVKWQKLGCGIASLAMLIDFYKPKIVPSVDALLREGINAGAFINGAGWSHQGLVLLASKYGLKGESYDLSRADADAAFAKFKEILKEGPVIASVHYKFEPQNPIPHLVVINGIDNDMIYFNDPASASGGKNISVQDFIKAWKKRFIAVRA